MDDDPESALIAELRALARRVGASGNEFSIVHDGTRVAVSYVSGTGSNVTFEAGYDASVRAQSGAGATIDAPHGYRDAAPRALSATRPLRITLRREDAGDVAAKREGVAKEWQAGDEEFDRRVYVDSPTTDAAVLAAVLNAEVRTAVLALLGLGFQQVQLDHDGKVRAHLTQFLQLGPRQAARGRQAVEAFTRILGSLPTVIHSGGRHPGPPLVGWTWILGAIGAVGWATNVGYAGLVGLLFELVFPPRPQASDLGVLPVLATVSLGITGGCLGARAYGRAVRRRVLGRSDAHQIVQKAQIASFGGISVLVFTVALLGALALARH